MRRLLGVMLLALLLAQTGCTGPGKEAVSGEDGPPVVESDQATVRGPSSPTPPDLLLDPGIAVAPPSGDLDPGIHHPIPDAFRGDPGMVHPGRPG